MNRYLLDNRRPEAGERFAALAEMFDPWTFRHLDDLGLGEGWRCWEVGAGGVSVPRGLAERVGTSGRVLATDIDVSWTEPAAGGALEVRRHDVIRDPPPSETFDLVHARLVLVHLKDRAAAMRVMIDALRPGGWLVIEDGDPALQPLACPDERGPDEALANRLRTRIRTLMAERGADLAYGRTLPRLLRESDLTDVERRPISRSRHARARSWRRPRSSTSAISSWPRNWRRRRRSRHISRTSRAATWTSCSHR